MAGLVMPWMLSRSTLRWRFAPPLPRPLPPFPRPDMSACVGCVVGAPLSPRRASFPGIRVRVKGKPLQRRAASRPEGPRAHSPARAAWPPSPPSSSARTAASPSPTDARRSSRPLGRIVQPQGSPTRRRKRRAAALQACTVLCVLICVQAGNQVSGHPPYSHLAECHFHISREPLSLNCALLFRHCALLASTHLMRRLQILTSPLVRRRRSDDLERSGSSSPTTPRDPHTSSSRRTPAPSLTAQTAAEGRRRRRRAASAGVPVRRRVDERSVGRAAAGTRGTVITTPHRDHLSSTHLPLPLAALCNGPR